MTRKTINQEKRLYLMAALILLVGLAGSIVVYLTASNDPGNALGYMIIDGQAYPIMPQDSKMYRHDLQVYGGKYSVAADEFIRWFSGLWHGRTLAFTMTVITLLISLGIFFVAKTAPPALPRDSNTHIKSDKEEDVS
jgi:hypothetical protein